MMNKTNYIIEKGILVNADSSIIQSNGKKYNRAVLNIEANNNKYMISTLDKNVIELALQNIGKPVSLKYTKNGNYNNLLDKTFQVLDEVIVDNNNEEIVSNNNKEIYENSNSNVVVNKKPINNINNNNNDFERKQILIIRQNSYSHAINYINALLKAAELGIVEQNTISENDINLKTIKNFAHSIEEDVLRNDKPEDIEYI